ncbi:MAG: VanZ family protein [Woeseiaceae bacterium]
MPSLSRTFNVVLILVCIVAATIAIHLLPGLDSSRLENGIRNSLHFILFAIVAAAAYALVSLGPTSKFVIALAIATTIGILSELAQRWSGGAADITDVYRDLSGAATMLIALLFLSASRSAERGSLKRFALGTIAAGVALIVTLPLVYWTGALLFERSQHPVVLDFDSRYSRYRYFPINAEVTLVSVPAHRDTMLAELLLSKRGRSGLAIQTAKYDWSNESMLVFSAEVVEGSTAKLTIHINDGTNLGNFTDTDSGSITLADGRQEYRIPVLSTIGEAGRGDELTNIRQLVILARDKQAGARLRLDSIRLE